MGNGAIIFDVDAQTLGGRFGHGRRLLTQAAGRNDGIRPTKSAENRGKGTCHKYFYQQQGLRALRTLSWSSRMVRVGFACTVGPASESWDLGHR